MSEIDTFIEWTHCDRRTAAYCIARYNYNVNLALVYYFESPHIDVPADFEMPLRDSGGAHEEPQPASRRLASPPPPATSLGAGSSVPHPPEPTDYADALAAFKQPQLTRFTPVLFVPMGQTQFQPPHLPDTPVERPDEANASFADHDAQTVRCVVWRNGISWGDCFFADTTVGYADALRQLESNQLPTALVPDLGACDVDLVFRKTVPFE